MSWKLPLSLCLILSISTSVNGDTSALCPDNNCTCSGTYPSKGLTVDCHGHPDVDVDQLTEQLDSLLSSNLTYGRLTSLKIVNTPLTHVPRSVCRLTTLKWLVLDHNQLVRLPDNCFTNLTALSGLYARWNHISELQDGLFDELHNLTTLDLSRNKIASIGLKVFNSSAMLMSLHRVCLDFNNLTTLEPWPYFVGVNYVNYAHHRTTVSLSFNSIRNFTNDMGLEIKCGMKTMYLEQRLNNNNIEHVSDVLRGWGISLATVFCISPTHQDRLHSKMVLYGNYLNCDCVDFDFLKTIVFWAPKADWLDGIYCKMPIEFHNTRLTSVPLNKLVCDVTEQCPLGCRCVYRPANATLHLYCSNSNLTVLPLELPALPKSYTKYKLDLSNNRLLRHLEHRDYFVNTSFLDVSNCGIETVDNWKDLLLTEFVYLHGNQLTSLPRSIAALNASIKHLSLYNNSWRCGCGDKWMSKWLNENGNHLGLLNPADIVCASPQRLVSRNILHISEKEFCMDPVTEALAVGMSSIAGFFVLLVLAGVCVYRVKVWVYTRWKFHPFDRDECLGEDMDYDVFLCCSSEDHNPHGLHVLELLEAKDYRVCYHLRDFVAGEPIADNMCQAVHRSKRTLCLLSANFINSSYCMTEFDMAFHHNVAVKRTKRLIVLMVLDSPNDLYANDASEGTAALHQYLRQYTYIDYTADDWLDKLLYALPVRGMQQNPQRDNDDQPLLELQ